MQDMGINKLANMFMGNPQPLAQKVQQAQQGVKPGQIPPDLEQAIALQKIQEMHAAAQNQQAMQAGGPQPTVVDKLRQMLQQQPQAQAQPEGTAPPPMQHPMAPQGMPPQGQPPQSQPQGLAAAQPQGAPQMPQVQAAHGGSLAHLMSNLGRHYDGGGIVAFAGKDERVGSEVPKPDAEDTSSQFVQDISKLPQAFNDLKQRAREEDAIKAAQDKRMEQYQQDKLAAQQKTSFFNYLFGTPSREKEGLAKLTELSNAAPAAAPAAPQIPGTPYDRSNATRRVDFPQAAAPRPPAPPRPAAGPAAPAAPQIPGTPYDRSDATRRVDFPQVSKHEQILQDMMNGSEDEASRKAIAQMKEMIGAPDNAAIQETIAALKAKREKAQANASPLADWARGVAGARPGQKWWQSGLAGSEYADRAAAQRETADTDFLNQILGHQQKISDTDRAYKKDLYTAATAAADKAADRMYKAAIAAGKSESDAAQLAQQERLKVMELASHEKTNAATNAAHTAVANIAAGSRAAGGADKQQLNELKALQANLQNQLKTVFGKAGDPIRAQLAQVNAAIAQMAGLGTMAPAPGAGSPGGTPADIAALLNKYGGK